jgi:hypothetical protein
LIEIRMLDVDMFQHIEQWKIRQRDDILLDAIGTVQNSRSVYHRLLC